MRTCVPSLILWREIERWQCKSHCMQSDDDDDDTVANGGVQSGTVFTSLGLLGRQFVTCSLPPTGLAQQREQTNRQQDMTSETKSLTFFGVFIARAEKHIKKRITQHNTTQHR